MARIMLDSDTATVLDVEDAVRRALGEYQDALSFEVEGLRESIDEYREDVRTLLDVIEKLQDAVEALTEEGE
jgi:hypothetical protein